MSKSTFPTQPILAIPWIKPCNLVVPKLTIKINKNKKYILKKKSSINICMKTIKETEIMI